MSAISVMLERHKREIAELQAGCSHDLQTKWMREQWAHGHETGYMVRCCHNCGAETARKRATS